MTYIHTVLRGTGSSERNRFWLWPVHLPFMGQSPLSLHNPDSDDVCRGQDLSVYPQPSQEFLQDPCSGDSALPVLPHSK